MDGSKPIPHTHMSLEYAVIYGYEQSLGHLCHYEYYRKFFSAPELKSPNQNQSKVQQVFEQ